jgi:putative phosphoesterase
VGVAKIGVLSDSHRKGELQNQVIEKLKSEGANYLLHLGDLVIEENLKSLKESNLPYAAVFGNNDRHLYDLQSHYKIEKEPYYLKIGDTKIKMMHLPYYMSADADIVLFGHLHKFSVEFKANTLFLNPGEVCARNKPLSECAIIELLENGYSVTYYFKEPQSTSWESREFHFIKDTCE